MKSRQNTLANYEKDCPGIPVYALVYISIKQNKTFQQNEIILTMIDCKLYL